MSYLLRGGSVSLGAFFLFYVVFSCVLVGLWPLLRKGSESLGANSLFALRLMPLLGAAALVMSVLVPSFLDLEPRTTEETIGAVGVLLACAGMFVIAAGIFSAGWAVWRTQRFVSSCAPRREINVEGPAVAVEIAAPTPVLLVAGAWRPKLLISEGARELLDNREMEMATRHEMAHVHRSDNLKKLALRLCGFPCLKDLERSWIEASEIAADDAAVTDQAAALDLASALLKIASSRNPARVPELAMSLAAARDRALRARVKRLLEWQQPAERRPRWMLRIALVAIPLLLAAVAYGPLLGYAHEFTELIIR
jgi:beta-lactamase regulating signal transducer with metallopeptidase domain